jgi:parallel beta-helix repeat protein
LMSITHGQFLPHAPSVLPAGGIMANPSLPAMIAVIHFTAPTFGPSNHHAVVVVHRGESIQAAVDAAQPGTEILVEPGTYYQTVEVSTPGLALVGLNGPHGEGVVIQNPGGADDGITATPTAGGFELDNVTVRGFADNGVLLEGVTGFTLSHVTAQDNGEYGLFPVFSSFGVIEGCTASGHRDTGIYVGQSAFVAVAANRTFDNVNGIEIENSSNIFVVGNDTFNNSAGILIDLLPGLDVTTSSDILVAHNFVHDNNRPNDGDPGSLESFVPSGTGILVLGADHVTILANRVTGNNFVGIGVASTLLLAEIAGLPPSDFTGIDPNPDGTLVLANYVVGNGAAPPPLGIPGADLLWDGSGTNNLWLGNIFDTSVPGILPGGG